MAVKLRLKRMGKKKRSFYRIVAADSRAPRDGRFIELVGTYDPVAKPHLVDYKEDRVLYWLSNGAQPTDTVRSLLRGKGLWLKWTLIKQGADEAKIATELEAWEKIQLEKAKHAEAKATAKAKEAAKKKAETAKLAEEESKAQEAPAEEVTEAGTSAPAAEIAEKAAPEAEASTETDEVQAEPVTEETAAQEPEQAEDQTGEETEDSKEKTEK